MRPAALFRSPKGRGMSSKRNMRLTMVSPIMPSLMRQELGSLVQYFSASPPSWASSGNFSFRKAKFEAMAASEGNTSAACGWAGCLLIVLYAKKSSGASLSLGAASLRGRGAPSRRETFPKLSGRGSFAIKKRLPPEGADPHRAENDRELSVRGACSERAFLSCTTVSVLGARAPWSLHSFL